MDNEGRCLPDFILKTKCTNFTNVLKLQQTNKIYDSYYEFYCVL